MTEKREQEDGPGFLTKLIAQQHYQEGLAQARDDHWVDAVVSYRDACTGDSRNSLYWLARGTAAQRLREWDEAAQAYHQALKLSPADPVVLYNQALLFIDRGLSDQARGNLEDILRLNTVRLGDRAALVHGRLGDLALRDGNYLLAKDHLLKALVHKPDDPYAMAAIEALPRLQEFSDPYDQDGRLPAKIGIYAYCGAILIGLPTDDGITIRAGGTHRFTSQSDVAALLRRLVDLVRVFRWHFDALVPLDPEAWPLAQALAQNLDTCSIRWPQLFEGGKILALALGVTEKEDVIETAHILRARSREVLVVSIGLRGLPWNVRPGPNVVCAPKTVIMPESEKPDEIGAGDPSWGLSLGDLTASQPPDETVQCQYRWYQKHNQLNFNPASFSDPIRPENASDSSLPGDS